jgi:hypothetical protein
MVAFILQSWNPTCNSVHTCVNAFSSRVTGEEMPIGFSCTCERLKCWDGGRVNPDAADDDEDCDIGGGGGFNYNDSVINIIITNVTSTL